MADEPRILYCHCAYAQVLPAEVRDRVFQTLSASGVKFEAVADLCELAARRDPLLKEISGSKWVRIAACHPRAVKGLFAAAGAALSERQAWIVNMRVQSAEEVVESLLLQIPTSGAALQADAKPPQPTPGAWKPWFPVIDYDRCTHCMQCLSFCLFDVYGVSAERKIQVQNPRNCKTDCPACARVCPENAIIFPKHPSIAINGDPDVDPPAKVDISALLGGDVYAVLRQRSATSKSRFSKDRDETAALKERQACLAKLQQEMGVPAEVLSALPSPEEIRRRAEEAQQRAQAALRRPTGDQTRKQ